MSPSHTRRRFITHATALGFAAPVFAVSPFVSASHTTTIDDPVAHDALHLEFPRQVSDRVREVVGASHRDLDRVKTLVNAQPALANATWDWGFGDWETALGAASHTGRRAIAEYLLSMGARPDIFCAAALGQLDIVKAFIAANPAHASLAGPHGITLLAHAEAGGDSAIEVVRYLESLGTANPMQTSLPLSAEQRQIYLGEYQVTGSPMRFSIVEAREQLAFMAADGNKRTLFRIADHEFHPTGAKAVRVRFEIETGRAIGVSIEDGGRIAMATRA